MSCFIHPGEYTIGVAIPRSLIDQPANQTYVDTNFLYYSFCSVQYFFLISFSLHAQLQQLLLILLKLLLFLLKVLLFLLTLLLFQVLIVLSLLLFFTEFVT